MEARATIREASVSRTFVAAVLVLVAMGLGAMGGYAAKGLGASSAAGQQVQVHPAAGTVLRQDNPAQVQVYPAAGTVLRQDNPVQNAAGVTSADRAISGGTRGDHGLLP